VGYNAKPVLEIISRDPAPDIVASAGKLALLGLRAFSSEVETGSRQENASKQESRAPFRFNRNGKGSSDVQRTQISLTNFEK
jgi:hypothetical protein